ncbi:nicotinamide riboside transporter PnuC [Thermoflexibacter ruber]|uniref:Nicotinamide riboside transporter PnuC n=1 Tax=Thermoflexibacter ruber TaxID=1003 RepID=A0A1I2JLM7_9BACT|nr:nicotinamide riboside transporter PnuC [Thermoflexibacter ruber]SFF55805.1 nicotinamide mononucleotide transporter [Thermoflexibacter ruber]
MLASIEEYIRQNPIEIIGSLLTILAIWLNTKQNAWGWIVGILSIVCYIYVFASVWLLGDFLLNIYFFVTSLYGWYQWRYGSQEHQELAVSLTKSSELLILISLAIVGAVLLGMLFSTYPQAAVPYWDAVITSFSLVAQWLLARKKLENWLVWIFVDVQASMIYFYKDLIVTGFLYIILTILAVKGYMNWKTSMS